MPAVIRADQASGAGAGADGKARKDLWQNREVICTEVSPGNTTWTWVLTTRPHGSSTTLSGASLQSCAWTPDRIGTYRLRCVVDEGLATEATTYKVYRVRYSSAGALVKHGYVLPAVDEEGGESNYDVDYGYGSVPNDMEWGEPLQFIVDDVETRLNTLETAGPGGDVTTPITRSVALDLTAMLDGDDWVDVGASIPIEADTSTYYELAFVVRRRDTQEDADEEDYTAVRTYSGALRVDATRGTDTEVDVLAYLVPTVLGQDTVKIASEVGSLAGESMPFPRFAFRVVSDTTSWKLQVSPLTAQGAEVEVPSLPAGIGYTPPYLGLPKVSTPIDAQVAVSISPRVSTSSSGELPLPGVVG